MKRVVLIGLLLALPSCGPSPGDGAPATTAVADLLIRGATILTMDADRNILADGAVAVLDGEIVAVGSTGEVTAVWTATDVIDAGPWDLLIPGLINGHGHAAMTLMRGVADDLELMDWLQNYIWPAEAQLVDEEFVRAGTRLAALEMIRTGTTTVVDMYFFEQAVAEELDAAGMRAIVGETVIDFAVPDHATPAEALAWSEGFLERWQGHPRITATVAPHAPYTVTPGTLQEAAALASRYDSPLLIHLAETAAELAQVQERHGASPVGHLANLGLLGTALVGAHGVWLSDGDIAMLAEHGVGLVHNPESNMKLASGTMRVPELLAAGVAVGLGTDGPASNNDLDMFGAMHAAALLQKLVRVDPTALPASDAVAMATIEGARALGLADRVGSIEVGKRADLVLMDGDSPNLVPRYDPYSHLAYAARGHDVRLTVVDGTVLYRDGRFYTLDAAAIVAEARRLGARVAAVVGR